MTKEMPTGVKVISVLYYIGAAFYLIFGLFFLVGSTFIGTMFGKLAPKLVAIGVGLSVFIGIFLIGLAVLDFFIGKGLWKGQNWARIVAIVLSILGTIEAITVMVGGIIGVGLTILVVGVIIIAYLGFNSSVKKAFS